MLACHPKIQSVCQMDTLCFCHLKHSYICTAQCDWARGWSTKSRMPWMFCLADTFVFTFTGQRRLRVNMICGISKSYKGIGKSSEIHIKTAIMWFFYIFVVLSAAFALLSSGSTNCISQFALMTALSSVEASLSKMCFTGMTMPLAISLFHSIC